MSRADYTPDQSILVALVRLTKNHLFPPAGTVSVPVTVLFAPAARVSVPAAGQDTNNHIPSPIPILGNAAIIVAPSAVVSVRGLAIPLLQTPEANPATPII